MNVEVKITKEEEFDVPLLLIGTSEILHEDKKLEPFKKYIKRVIDLKDFKGKKGDLKLIYTDSDVGPKRLLLIGLGTEDELDIEQVRKIVGGASRKARNLDVKDVGIYLGSFIRKKFDVVETAQAVVQSMIMGSYQNTDYKTKDLEKFKKIDNLFVTCSSEHKELVEKGTFSGKVVGDAVNLCRQLAWGPANYINPTKLANEAIRMEKKLGIKTKIIERDEAKEIGLTSYVAVTQGTDEPPKFIIMDYGSEKDNVDTIALIGKAITFDSGGISIKPSKNMEKMKADMTGGAVVIAAMEAIAKLKPNLRVVGIVPATDNMPSGKAYHPGDVITSYSGLTIEVISTDAEGRMVLNDALTYAAKHYQPKAMFDFATLTGSMMVALGEHVIGYFTNDNFLVEKLEKASKTSGEKIWRMPLWKDYDVHLKSDVADTKHTGGRAGGAIIAARFLRKFTMDVPWVHMDIAGVMEQSADKEYNPKGSKGPGVRLILEIIENWNK